MDIKQILTTLILVVLILIVYYSVYAQRNKQEKETKKMQDNLKVGDKVKITTTARLDVSGDNKPGTACYSGFDIQVVKE